MAARYPREPGAGQVVDVFFADFGRQSLPQRFRGQQFVHEAVFEGGARRVPADLPQEHVVLVREAPEGLGRHVPVLRDAVHVAFPQVGDQREVGLARLGRHVRTREGLDRGLVRAHAEHVHVDLEPVEQSGVVVAVHPVPGQDHLAERMQVDLVGEARQVVAVLGVQLARGDHLLPGVLEGTDRGAQRFDVRRAHVQEVGEVQREHGDPVVGGRPVDRPQQVRGGDLARPADAEQRRNGIRSTGLLDDGALGSHHERGVVRYVDASTASHQHGRDEGQQQQAHEKVGDGHPEERERAGNAREESAHRVS